MGLGGVLFSRVKHYYLLCFLPGEETSIIVITSGLAMEGDEVKDLTCRCLRQSPASASLDFAVCRVLLLWINVEFFGLI